MFLHECDAVSDSIQNNFSCSCAHQHKSCATKEVLSVFCVFQLSAETNQLEQLTNCCFMLNIELVVCAHVCAHASRMFVLFVATFHSAFCFFDNFD